MTRMSNPMPPSPTLPAFLPALAACGAGTAAIAAGSSGSGGTTGGPPSITLLEVPAPEVAPAPITLEASQPLTVQLRSSRAGAPAHALTGLRGTRVRGNRVVLPPTDLAWDFQSDLGSEVSRDLASTMASGNQLTVLFSGC